MTKRLNEALYERDEARAKLERMRKALENAQYIISESALRKALQKALDDDAPEVGS